MHQNMSQEQLNETEFEEREFMHVDEFREVVGGKIFSATFVKKNGEVRKIRARLGVKKHLQGGELKYSPSDKNYLIVFDLDKSAYRTINFNTLLNIKYSKLEWEFLGE